MREPGTSSTSADLEVERRPWALGALLAAAFAVRLPGIIQQSLWTDEVLTAGVIPLSWHDMYERLLLGGETHPVLFHTLAKLWGMAFGYGKVPVRMLSVLLGTLFVLATFRLVGLFASRQVALWAAVLAAFSPYAIYFSQEVRSYMLLALLQTSAYCCFFSWQRRPRTWSLVAWVVLQTASFYAHAYGLFGLVVQGVLLLDRVRREGLRRETLLPLAWAALIGVLCLPWVGVIVFIKSRFLTGQAPLGYQEPVGLGHLGYIVFAMFYGYSLGPSVAELHQPHGVRAVLAAQGPILALAFAALAPPLLVGARRLWARPADRLPVALGLLLPLTLALGVSMVSTLAFNVRFVIATLPFLLLVAAEGLAALSGLRRLAALPFLLLVAASIYNYQTDPRYFREDFEDAARFLEYHADAPVLEAQTPQIFGYFAPKLPMGELNAAALDAVPHGERRWLVWNRAWTFDRDGALDRKAHTDFVIESEQRYPGFVIQHVRRK